MILTYKYRLKDNHCKRLLQQFSVSCNQVWNYCVATQRKAQTIYKNGKSIKWPSHFDFEKLTKGSSKELKIHAQTVQNVCEQFVKSRDLHRKCPKFRRSIGIKRSLGWVPFQQQSRQINGNSVSYLGKTFRFFGAKRRPLPEKVKGGYFVEDARGKWYVCFQVEVSGLPIGTNQIGIDLGLKDLVVTSDGERFGNPKTLAKYAQKLAVAQRANNKKQVKTIHAKITNTRKDYLHKASYKLANANRLIVVGNVSSSRLAQTKMAKSIYDASWSTFREMLRYKVSRHGAKYLEVNENLTTQTCSICGSLPESRPKGIAGLGIREWVCSSCGATHDRDVNAAKNILAIGLSAQPRDDESRRVA